MFCEVDRDKIRCTVDAILFLRRYHPFPPRLNCHIGRLNENGLFQSKNEELMTELTYYLYFIVDPNLCAKHIKWPTANRKQFFQDVQAFLAAASKDSSLKRLPRAKSSSLCFPTTSKDFEHQLAFIYQTVVVVLKHLAQRTTQENILDDFTIPFTENQEVLKTDEARAVRLLVFKYHKCQAIVERNNKTKELHETVNRLLSRYVNLMNISEVSKAKIRNDHRAIKEYIAPIISRNEKLTKIRTVLESIQQELEEINNRKADAKVLLSMVNNPRLQKLAENNNINLHNEGRLSLAGLFQLHRVIIVKQIAFLNVVTNAPQFELLRRQKDRLSQVKESMMNLIESLTKRLEDKEGSITQLHERCSLMKRELEGKTRSTAQYRPSFSIHDSLRFSDSVCSFSPVTGSVESRNSFIENVKKGFELRKSGRSSYCSNLDSPETITLRKRCSMFNSSISDPHNEILQAPLSSSSPISAHLCETNDVSTYSFKEDMLNLIDDIIPELRLESFHFSGSSDSDPNASDGDEFGCDKSLTTLAQIGSSGTPQADLIARYLELRQRLTSEG